MSHPMVQMFQISGPTNEEYPARPICIPQVGMPANLSLPSGTNATIQVVEAAKHGAALYTVRFDDCVPQTEADPSITVRRCHPHRRHQPSEGSHTTELLQRLLHPVQHDLHHPESQQLALHEPESSIIWSTSPISTRVDGCLRNMIMKGSCCTNNLIP